jgi:malate dehydrogenase (oxaloacetate-decarboxylating)(NADP+)
MATGRSDYPNQVNNVLGFPYIFRGALDVRATTINDAMKIAAAQALAELAREDVPDDVAAAYQGMRPKFGPNYIIPVPFDPAPDLGHPRRRREGRDGDRRRAQADRRPRQIRAGLSARRDPIASTLQRIYDRVRRQPKRVVFAEGEEEQVMRAAVSYRQPAARHRHPGRPRGGDEGNRPQCRHRPEPPGIEIINAGCRAATRSMPTISTSACSARASCSATASA